ncbi:MAG: hypothetical protein CVU72_00775 [Deltaproteobacteria bacterium HGW-Deltaproteobacteria-7]|jgi:hypothetical protein|nr:MAG: hypothetical protein CVU72_00775 [Deltaproteobacteria bacterium HGW-Deltaproteobacteria-7]PKN19236.1 MAG: hypothetical protein CVU71_06905 [Deltaproteobacteria bacterium HGW-Deltaproteobacteria-6]
MKRLLRTIFVIVLLPVMVSMIVACAGKDRFIVHHGNGTVLDTKTNLMWAGKDNGSDVSWTAAKSYCENYSAGNYNDWRMPTNDELASLYDAQQTQNAPCAGNFSIHLATELIKITCIETWSSEARDSQAANFNFVQGNQRWYPQIQTYGTRALPVRSNK